MCDFSIPITFGVSSQTTNHSKSANMKFFITLALLVAAAAALPVGDDKDAQIIEQKLDNIGVEGYSYGSKTSNGIEAQETGQLKNVGTENEALEVRGGFSYVGPDGVTYAVTYISNEFGFQPSGAHLPQVPA